MDCLNLTFYGFRNLFNLFWRHIGGDPRNTRVLACMKNKNAKLPFWFMILKMTSSIWSIWGVSRTTVLECSHKFPYICQRNPLRSKWGWFILSFQKSIEKFTDRSHGNFKKLRIAQFLHQLNAWKFIRKIVCPVSFFTLTRRKEPWHGLFKKVDTTNYRIPGLIT